MNVAAIKNLDIANGKGLRVSLFVSGCPHHCTGCFNAEAWRYEYGEPYNKATETKILTLLQNERVQGLSLLGGEPFAQKGDDLLELVQKVSKMPNKDIWAYSGYLYEQIKDNELLKYIDVLVDGPFVLERKDPRLQFCGSSNQRIIDVKETRKKHKVVLYDLEDDFTRAE